MMMAEAQGDDDEIFVYMGGDQQVPDNVRRAKIHRSVKNIPAGAFRDREQVIYVEFHDDIEIIEEEVFEGCIMLMSVKLLGVKIIQARAFLGCHGLADVEFGDKLETIETSAFNGTALRKVTISTARNIEKWAFANCPMLSDVECGEGLETLRDPFMICHGLERIVLPLKGNIIEDRTFRYCPKLTTVDLVVSIHNTVASLHLKSWRSEMMVEINQINQVLPSTAFFGKTLRIQQWLRTVTHRLDHFKAEHKVIIKEAATTLELALWKANLGDKKGNPLDREGVRTTRGSRKRARKEICVTSGASIVIKNVLPFLQLLD